MLNTRKINIRDTRGFTMFELLTVVTIVALISTASISIFGRIRESMRINKQTEEIKTEILKAINRAKTGKSSKSKEKKSEFHGVFFDTSQPDKIHSYVRSYSKGAGFSQKKFSQANSQAVDLFPGIEIKEIKVANTTEEDFLSKGIEISGGELSLVFAPFGEPIEAFDSIGSISFSENEILVIKVSSYLYEKYILIDVLNAKIKIK